MKKIDSRYLMPRSLGFHDPCQRGIPNAWIFLFNEFILFL